MKRLLLRLALAVGLVSTATVALSPAAQAVVPTCGVDGYATYITYSANFLRTCFKPTPGGPGGTETAYLTFAQLANSSSPGATFRVATEQSGTGTNPLLNKKTVSSWFAQKLSYEHVAINGSFFDCTESCFSTAHMSFPIKRNGTIVTTGNNVAGDDQYAKRTLCLTNGVATVNNYTLNSTNSTGTNIASALSSCDTAVVGFDPLVDVDNGASNALTYAGVRVSGGAYTLCFFVGGWQSRAVARQTLLDFGCNPTIQWDSGHSTEMEVDNNPSSATGQGYSVVTTYSPYPKRGVAQAFLLGV